MRKFTLHRETKIGIFATICIAAMIWGINFLKGRNIFSKNCDYYAWYPTVSGLQVNNAVLVNGFKVGLVNKIQFEYENPDERRFLVTFVIGKKYRIPLNSTAQLMGAGPLGGGASVNLITSNSATYHNPGDTLASTVGVGSMSEFASKLPQLMRSLQNLANNLTQTADALNAILGEKGRANTLQALANLNLTLRNTARLTATIDTMLRLPHGSLNSSIANIQSISQNLKNNNEQISRTLENFAALGDTLARSNLGTTLSQLNLTLNRLDDALSQINQGKGTAGMLIYNDSLYIHLERATKKLEMLLQDIHDNPKKYVKVSLF